MTGKHGCWRIALVLMLGLAAPSSAWAGPFFGEWSWFWHPGPDCPCRAYSPCHYWTPMVYKARGCFCPSNLDQYPPGPAECVLPSFAFNNYRCAAIPPTLTGPYADSAGYYGRQIVPLTAR